METDFSSHSTNSIYCELLDGKMLSTVTASAVVTTVQFVLRFVVDCFLWMLMSACISMEKKKKVRNEHVRMPNLFSYICSKFCFFFFLRTKVLHWLSSCASFWHTLSTCTMHKVYSVHTTQTWKGAFLLNASSVRQPFFFTSEKIKLFELTIWYVLACVVSSLANSCCFFHAE